VYPTVDSNGKIERWHQTLKQECIRPGSPLSPTDANRIVTTFVVQYNHHRLHSAIGYITPADKLNQREAEIFDQHRQKLAQACDRRKLYWQESERLH
jgi:transposase InsO family protein